MNINCFHIMNINCFDIMNINSEHELYVMVGLTSLHMFNKFPLTKYLTVSQKVLLNFQIN
jgi:hypothetical protein